MRFTRAAITPPAVSLEEIKALGKVEHSANDAELTALIQHVTSEFCRRTNTALLFETVAVSWDVWRAGEELRLPIGPLTETNATSATVTIEAIETTGTTETIAATGYRIHHGDRPSVVMTDDALPQGTLSLSYLAGKGETIAAIAQHQRVAIAAQVIAIFDNDDRDDPRSRLAPAYAAALHTSQRVGIS